MDLDVVKHLLEDATTTDRFAMPALAQSILAAFADTSISRRYATITSLLGGERIGIYIFASLLRAAFLIELVKAPKIETTKTEVRWADRLGVADPRYASFATCYQIFDQVTAALIDALSDAGNRELLALIYAHHLIAYELPLDYVERELAAPIHRPGNIVWLWDELPKRIVRLRAFLTDVAANSEAAVFVATYSQKVQVKTYLTDRVLTGPHKTNREKRWETHPASVHFALRRMCMGIEYELMTQLCRFEGFPSVLRDQLMTTELLMPGEVPFRCPITKDPLNFSEFRQEILNPVHGKSLFQVGHLNPLKAINEDPRAGHTALNISWISSDGNRIQGHLTLDETRTLLGRIVENYAMLNIPLGAVKPTMSKLGPHAPQHQG